MTYRYDPLAPHLEPFMGNCPAAPGNGIFLKRRLSENCIFGTPGAPVKTLTCPPASRFPLFLKKTKGVLRRLLMKRKRELQGPGLHVNTCTHGYSCANIWTHTHACTCKHIYVYVIDTVGPRADSCRSALTRRCVVVRERKGGYTGGA